MAKRKSLPHNTEAEKAVLGAMLRAENKFNEGISALTPDDFYPENQNNIAIFSAMMRLNQRHVPIDIQTIVNELINANELEISGGADYLLELMDSVVTFTNFDHYVSIVQDQALLRRYLVAIENIQKEYYETDIGDVTTFLGNSDKILRGIAEKRKVGNFVDAKTVSERLNLELQTMEAATTDSTVTGTPTGYVKLNRLTHGFHGGEFIVLAARPGVGKTALSLNIAYKAALNGYPVAYFSLEMPSDTLFKRLASAESCVPFESLLTGYGLNAKNARLRLKEACDRLGNIQFYVDDTSGINLLDLSAKVKALYNKVPNLSLIVVDYIGLVTTNMKTKSDSRQQEVQLVSQTLKRLALELKVPIIGVAQLNRKVDDRPGGEPQLSDLRESGSIEQDADLVLLLHEPKVDVDSNNGKRNLFEKQDAKVNAVQEQVAKKEGGPDTTLVNVIIAKNRSGKTGRFQLLFRKSFCSFDAPSEESENELAELEKERITYFSRD